MTIVKKIALIFLIIVFIAGLFFLYFRYFPGAFSVWLKQNSTPENINSDTPTVFDASEVSYVGDPDVGTVTGSGDMNEVARKFLGIFHVDSEKPEDITKVYKRYTIKEVSGGVVKVVMLGGDEPQTLSLVCQPEKTALFKSIGMEFVSAGFNVTREIKVGDILFTNCVSERCDEVGPECIIIRFPSD